VITPRAAAKAAFLKCLGEACEKTGWRVHAWCLMSNHDHLALETPQANLVDGIHWLQGTFSMRFNRLRKEQGHLFQGRYKALPVDPGTGLGPLCQNQHGTNTALPAIGMRPVSSSDVERRLARVR